MLKTRTRTVKRLVPKVQIDDFMPFVDGVKASLDSAIVKHKSYADRDENTLKSLISEKKNIFDAIKRARTSCKKSSKDYRLAITASNKHKVSRKRVRRELLRLYNHPAIYSLRIVKNELSFITNPLYTDIRVDGGSIKTRRAFLGMFRIVIDLNSGRGIYVKNLSLNTRGRSHWSVSSNYSACQGDWQAVFNDARKRGNWSLFVTTLIQYLQSTADGGAYTRSHLWRDNRHIVVNSEESSKWAIRRFLMYVPKDIPAEISETTATVVSNDETQSVYKIVYYDYHKSCYIDHLSNDVHKNGYYDSYYDAPCPKAVDTMIANNEEVSIEIINAMRNVYSNEYCLNFLDTLSDSEALKYTKYFNKTITNETIKQIEHENNN